MMADAEPSELVHVATGMEFGERFPIFRDTDTDELVTYDPDAGCEWANEFGPAGRVSMGALCDVLEPSRIGSRPEGN
jgi:hypothetical protein